MSFTSILFSFSGRINRAKWWLSVLIIIVLNLVGMVITIAASGIGTIVGLIVTIVNLWIALAAGTKRLHDLNRTGAWLVFFIGVPVLLFIVFIALAGMSAGLALISGGASDAELAAAFAEVGGIGLLMGALYFAVAIWALVWFGCLRGTTGANQYGPDPLVGV